MNSLTSDDLAPLTPSERQRLLDNIGGVLVDLSPAEFEEGIALLWAKMGYETRVTQASVDSGIDILARGPEGVIAIQAKCYSKGNNVGVREVREYAALRLRPDVDEVVIVTSSGFTDVAIREAKLLGVRLVDCGELWGLLRKYLLPSELGEDSARSLPSHGSSEANKRRGLIGFLGSVAMGCLLMIIVTALFGDWGSVWVFFVIGALASAGGAIIWSIRRMLS